MNNIAIKNAILFVKVTSLFLTFFINSLSAYGSKINCQHYDAYNKAGLIYLRSLSSDTICFLPTSDHLSNALPEKNIATEKLWGMRFTPMSINSINQPAILLFSQYKIPKLVESDGSIMSGSYYHKPSIIKPLDTDLIKKYLIPPDFGTSEYQLELQWQQLITHMKTLDENTSNIESKSKKSFIYLSTSDQQLRVVVIPSKDLVKNKQEQLNEMTIQALHSLYNTLLDDEEEQVSTEEIADSNAGDDEASDDEEEVSTEETDNSNADDDDDGNRQINNPRYSFFYVMDGEQLSEPAVSNKLLQQRLRVLDILRNRAQIAIDQGNNQLATILNNRITLIEIDIEYFSTQLTSDSTEVYSNIAELILKTLQRDSEEIQQYEHHRYHSDLFPSMPAQPDLKTARSRIGRQTPGGNNQAGSPDSTSQQGDTPSESSNQEQASGQSSRGGANGGSGRDDDGDDDRHRDSDAPHDLTEGTSQTHCTKCRRPISSDTLPSNSKRKKSNKVLCKRCQKQIEEEPREYVTNIIKATTGHEKIDARNLKLLTESAMCIYNDLKRGGGTKFTVRPNKEKEMKNGEKTKDDLSIKEENEKIKETAKIIAEKHQSSPKDSSLTRVILTQFITQFIEDLSEGGESTRTSSLQKLKKIKKDKLRYFFEVSYNAEDHSCTGIGAYGLTAVYKNNKGEKVTTQVIFSNHVATVTPFTEMKDHGELKRQMDNLQVE